MTLQLAQEEPEAGPWRVELLTTVVNAVTRRRPDPSRPAVLAIDGRSNNGKTRLAARISELVPGSAVIHTDDIAWEHSRFGWAGLLAEGILDPVHRGQPASYRPPRWDEHGRQGCLEVPAGCPLLIIEGDGAGTTPVAPSSVTPFTPCTTDLNFCLVPCMYAGSLAYLIDCQQKIAALSVVSFPGNVLAIG